MARRPIPASDVTFLRADRPYNHIVVTGVLWFEEQPDWDSLEAIVRERLVERYPVLSQRPVLHEGTWWWEDDPKFSLDRHVHRVTLDEPSDLQAARAYASREHSRGTPMDRSPWQIEMIPDVRGLGSDGGSGGVVIIRFHHVLADGIRIVQLLFGLCEVDTSAMPTARVGLPARGGSSVLGLALAGSRQVVGDAADVAGGTVLAAGSVLLSGPVGGARRLLEKGRRLVSDPGSLVADVAGLSSPENRLMNDWASVSSMVVRARTDSSPLRGEAGESKSLHWLTGVSAARVIATAKGSGTTFNDVLLTGAAGGLRRYLAEHHDTDTTDLNFFIPISLKPMDTALPRELGNYFAVLSLALPVGADDVESRRQTVHERMSRLKHSDEAIIAAGLQKVVAMGPERVGAALTTSFADNAIGSITNVPGPRGPMTLGGARVAGVLGWNPTTSQQSLGVCIFSYNGEVTVGLSTDDMIISDPRSLLRCFHEEFTAMGLLERGTDV